jgi:chromate transporter
LPHRQPFPDGEYLIFRREISQRASGWAGGLVLLLAIFAPAALLVLGALPFWASLRQHGAVRRALAGVNAAVVGVLGAALYDPVWTSAIQSRGDVALALGVFGLLLHGRCPPVLAVGLAALGGWGLAGP